MSKYPFKVGDTVRRKKSNRNNETYLVRDEAFRVEGFQRHLGETLVRDYRGGLHLFDSLELVTPAVNEAVPYPVIDIRPFDEKVRDVLDGIRELLIEKNTAYGNSALEPARIFSTASKTEQLRVRIDDKLSRLRNGDTSEDVITDLIGYLVLLKIAEGE